jgi:hypothetical protein
MKRLWNHAADEAGLRNLARRGQDRELHPLHDIADEIADDVERQLADLRAKLHFAVLELDGGAITPADPDGYLLWATWGAPIRHETLEDAVSEAMEVMKLDKADEAGG